MCLDLSPEEDGSIIPIAFMKILCCLPGLVLQEQWKLTVPWPVRSTKQQADVASALGKEVDFDC